MRLFHHRGFSGAVLASLLTVMGLSGLVFFLSQFLQLVQQHSTWQAGLFEVPAAIGLAISGLVAGVIACRTSVRGVVADGIAASGPALAACTGREHRLFHLAPALFFAGLGTVLTFTVTSDLVLSSVPKDQAGAASAVSETAYELGGALGIALLGSIITGIYRGFTTPPDIPANAADAAHDSLGGAVEAAASLPHAQAASLLTAARDAFTDGCQAAAGVSAGVFFTAALAM